MTMLSREEQAAAEAASGADILPRVESWVAVNSGTRNLGGVATMGNLLANAFSALPGDITMVEPTPVDAVRSDGVVEAIDHGRHLHLTVRPNAPVQMLFTGHMDTVFPIDHPFQAATWREDGALNGPGAADMKGGLALMKSSSIRTRKPDLFHPLR